MVYLFDEGEVEDRLYDILYMDDVLEFRNYIINVIQLNPCWNSELLLYCLRAGAKNCSLHMLRGEMPGGKPSVGLKNFSAYRPSALYQALVCLPDPDVIEAIIKDCGGEHLANEKSLRGLLPLHMMLGDRMYIKYLSKWSPGQSLIKLIILLFVCLSKVKSLLECVRVLAQYTDSVNEVAFGFVQNDEPVFLASLLLLAHERVMTPFSSGETIKERIRSEVIVSQVICGQCDASSAWAVGLLEIFEKAGAALSMYYMSLEENAPPLEVVIQVAHLLQNGGFHVTYKDIDLSDVCRIEQPNVLRSICEKEGIEIDSTFKESKKAMFSSLKSAKAEVGSNPVIDEFVVDYGFNAKVTREMLCGPHNMSSNYQGSRSFSSIPHILKINAKKLQDVDKLSGGPPNITVEYPRFKINAGKHSWACSLRNMAYRAMKLKRGIRFL